MEVLVGVLNQEKAIAGAFSVIVKTDGSFGAQVLGILSPGAGLEVAGTGLALGVFVASQSVNLAGAIKLKFKTTHDTGSNELSTGSVVQLNKIFHLATQHSLHTSLPCSLCLRQPRLRATYF